MRLRARRAGSRLGLKPARLTRMKASTVPTAVEVLARAQSDLAQPGGGLRADVAQLVGLLRVELVRRHSCDSTKARASDSRPVLIFNVETVEDRTVEVEHADQLAVAGDQRHHQFGVEAESQAMWPGKACTSATRWVWRVARGGAAHALVERDAHAGRQALERADHQLGAVEEIEADPVELRAASDRRAPTGWPRWRCGRARRASARAPAPATVRTVRPSCRLDFRW